MDQATTSEIIRPEDEQPGITGATLEVPVIDISAGSESADIVRRISEASSEWGMFQIVNHGIPDEVITKMHRFAKEYFEYERKRKKNMLAMFPGCNKNSKNRGWVDIFVSSIWPPCPNDLYESKDSPSFRHKQIYEDYAKRLNRVADKLLECLSLGLGLEQNAMKNAIGDDNQKTYLMMSIKYYKPCPRPNGVLGIEVHSNVSALALLVPVQGLQLQVLRNKRWYDVKYIPSALIVRIGDAVEILSNGKYKEVFHKTITNKDEARMLWPVALRPSPQRRIGPIPELIDEENPAKFKTRKYKDCK